jgi:MFS transporter, FHS family, L-fucose permease
VVVLVLAGIFLVAKLPDLVGQDEFHLDDTDNSVAYAPVANKTIAFPLLWLNVVVLAVAVGMIFSAIVAIPSVGAKLGLTDNQALFYAAGVLVLIGTVVVLTQRGKITNHSIWTHAHFSGATLAQFFYVAAQCGIFAYFINYMTSQIPPVPEAWQNGTFASWLEVHQNGQLGLSDKGASNLASVGFMCFLAGRVIGAALLKKFGAHQVLFAFACLAGVCSLLVFFKLGWISAVALFLTYLFMSIMFPTIFSLGIHGLGARAKKASSFIVMAIMGGAIMPKLMGHMGDVHGMSAAFIVPTGCFAIVALYGFSWQRLSQTNKPVD